MGVGGYLLEFGFGASVVGPDLGMAQEETLLGAEAADVLADRLPRERLKASSTSSRLAIASPTTTGPFR